MMSKYGWYIIAGVVIITGFVLLVVTGGKVKLPTINLENKLRVIDAEVRAKKLEKKLGKERALVVIEQEYIETIAKLDEEEQKEHAKLKNDPRKLAKLLAGKSV